MIETNSPVIVTMQDLRTLDYCSRGSRAFFEGKGLNWSLFLQQGIPASELEKFDDEMVREAIAHAKTRAGVEK